MEYTTEEFEAVFHEYRHRLNGFFRKLGARPDTWEDLTHSTFGIAVQHLYKVKDHIHLERWLFQIARNLWRHEQRKSKTLKRTGIEISLDDLEPVSLSDAAPMNSKKKSTPLDKLLFEEEQSRVREAIGRLPNQMRRCVILFYFQEKSIEEIVKIMKLKSGTVKSHLGQARKKLGHSLR